MKQLFFLSLFQAAAIILIPLVVVTVFGRGAPPGQPVSVGSAQIAPAQDDNENGDADGKCIVKVYIKQQDTVADLELNEYIKGVVASEMPALFHPEALKAQAVAARTYAVSKLESGYAPPEHKGAALCTESTHCQAWLSKEDAYAKWNSPSSDEYWSKIEEAVDGTGYEIMVYNSRPIKAFFHNSSIGKTESALEVWGEDLPYLKSVDSPGEELYAGFYSSADVPFDEFKSKILSFYPNAEIKSKDSIGKPVLDDAGYVKYVNIGGADVKGIQIRSLFGLRSAAFNITATDENVHFDVKGSGHGVGMSQYGANYLAKQGKSYREILNTYYQNISITMYNQAK